MVISIPMAKVCRQSLSRLQPSIRELTRIAVRIMVTVTVEVEKVLGRTTAVRVGGASVMVCEGTITL